MRRRLILAGGFSVLSSVLAVAAADRARADDWTSAGLDAAHARASAERSGSRFTGERWSHTFATNAYSISSPAAADGIVVVGGHDGLLHAVAASDGRALWSFRTGDSIEASPAIQNGRVFVPSLDGKLYALHLADGQLAWQHDLGGLEQSSPVVVHDRLGDGVVVVHGFPGRTLLRLDAITGDVVWETTPDVLAQFSNSSAVSDGVHLVVGANEGHYYGFDLATGTRLWTVETDGFVNLSAPVIAEGRAFLLPGGESSKLHAVDVSTGKSIAGWPVELPAAAPSGPGNHLFRHYTVSSLSALPGRLIFNLRIDDNADTDGDTLADRFSMRESVVALSTTDGHPLWQTDAGHAEFGSFNDTPKSAMCPTPALYQPSSSYGAPFAVVTSTVDSTLRIVNTATGALLWSTVLGSISRASPIFSNGRLFLATDDGALLSRASATNMPPAAPTFVGGTVRTVSDVAPQVDWAAALDPEGDNVSYQVRLDHDGEVLETWESMATLSGDTLWRIPGALTAGVSYMVALRARDSNGAWSDWSAPQFLNVVAAPPIAVNGQGVTNLGDALRNAHAGDIVTLGVGTVYLTETLRVGGGVTLEGAGAQRTILDATGQATAISLDGSAAGQPSEVRGLTVTGARVGIAVAGTHDARISHVILRNNSDAGLDVGAAGTATLTNATLVSNGTGARSFGVLTTKNNLVLRNQTGLASDHLGALASRYNDVSQNAIDYQGLNAGLNDLADAVAFSDFAKHDLHLGARQPTTDKGDPADDFAAEPQPNGGRINLGAFGGTADAELSLAPSSSVGADPGENPTPVGQPPEAPRHVGTTAPSATPEAGEAYSSGGGCSMGGEATPSLPTVVAASLLALALLLRLRRRAVRVPARRARGRRGTKMLLAALLATGTWLATSGTAHALTCNWQAGGSSNFNTSTGNWSCGRVPTSVDDVNILTGVQCTITASISVQSLHTKLGTVIQNSGQTITTTYGWWHESGTFTGGNSDINVGTVFTLSGGTFTSTSGLMLVGGDFNHSAGTFTHNSGTVMLTSATTQAFTSTSTPFNHLVINDGLVGYWKLDESAIGTAVDSSGYGNSLTSANSPTVSSLVPSNLDFTDAKSVAFTRTASYTTTPYLAAGSLPAELQPTVVTMSAWYKATSVDTTAALPNQGGEIVSASNRYALRVFSSSQMKVAKQVNASTWVELTATATNALDGNWHHMVGIITASGMSTYFDGVASTTNSDTQAIYYTTPTSGINIGRNPTGNNYNFSGNIDEVRIYNRALTATEVAALYASGLPGTSAATHTLSGSPTVAGDFVLASGKLVTSTNSMSVAGNWWNYGGVFTTTTGTVTFNGTATGKSIQAGGSNFYNVTINGSGGGWTLADTTKETLAGSLAISNGTLTSTPGTLEIRGAFNKTGGTFTHNSGKVLLTSTADQAFATNSTTFNHLTINDGLVGYWKLDETSIGTAADSSGYGNDATAYNTPTVSALVPSVDFSDAKSVSFASASTEYLSTSQTTLATELQPTVLTLSAWYRATSVDTAPASDLVSGNNRYVIRVASSTSVVLVKQTGAAAWTLLTGTVSGALDGNWHHLAGVINGSGMIVYFDGVAVNSNSDTAAIYYTTPTSGVNIGRNPTFTGCNMNGNIDDVRIYKRTLTPSEIRSLAIGRQPATVAATHTMTGTPTISGDLVIASGELSTGSNNMTVAGSWWNYGGLFTTTTSTVTLSGTGTNYIRSGGSPFYIINTTGAGSWTLLDRTVTLPNGYVTIGAGTLALGSYTLRTGDINRTGTFTPGTGMVVLATATSRAIDAGNFTNLRIEPLTATELAGYWKFDEAQGPTTRDMTGSHDGTLTGNPLWLDSGLSSTVSFDNNAALTFGGTSDYVDLGTGVVTTSAAFSVCAWVNMSSLATNSGYHYFVSKSGTTGASFTLSRRGDTSKFAFQMTASDGGATTKADSTTTPSASTWYHLCGTYDAANIRLYVNGALQGTTAFSSGWNAAGSTIVGAGKESSALTKYTAGSIDDVRIYNVALTAAQAKALGAGTYPAGTTSAPTLTLGANTTTSGTFAQDSGNFATGAYTLAATGAASIKSGTYTLGSAASTFSAGLNVATDGTLTMATTGGSVNLATGQTFTMDGTLNASAATAATIQSVSGNYIFTIGSTSTSTPVLNITKLAVKNTNTQGMNIDSVAGSVTTFTRFDNIAFSAGTGTQLLQIHSPALYLVSNGCTFDGGVTATTTYNVTLAGDSASTETRAIFGGATCASGGSTCEQLDNDDDAGATTGDGVADTSGNGAVIQWVKAAMADTNGTLEGYPVAAFEWSGFTYYASYASYHDVDSTTTDRVYVRTVAGATGSAIGAARYSWDSPSGVELIGAPRFNTIGGIHYVYVATNAGRVYRLIDTGSALNTDATWGAGSSNGYNCGCTIVSPLGMDTANLYFTGTIGGVATLFDITQATGAVASSYPKTMPGGGTLSAAEPALWVGADTFTYMFAGLSGHFYKWSFNTGSITTDNSSPIGTVNGRVSVIVNKVYGNDNAGTLWVLNPTTFSSTLWSYHDNVNHSGCSAGTACASTGGLYVDWLLGTRVFYGDGDGHLYGSYNSIGTTGAQTNAGFPYQPGGVSTTDVFASPPLYNAGILVAGTTLGTVYVIDTNNGTTGPAKIQTYRFGPSTKISGIGYDNNTSSYLISTSNATAKDGNLFYIAASTDPTPTFY